MASASPGPRGVMSGETLGAVTRLCKGKGRGRQDTLLGSGSGGGRGAHIHYFQASVLILHYPFPWLFTPGSGQEGAVALLETARSCLVPLPELGGLKWLDSLTSCVPCVCSPCQCQATLVVAPTQGWRAGWDSAALCSIVPGRVYVWGWAPWDLCGAGWGAAGACNTGVGPGSSKLSLQWNPLSWHCSTDRSSSIGSMESLDHPSQACYEGDPSPVDQGMYHSKRDSAYSSFSASSIASDCALSLRPEEAVSIDSSLQGPCKAPDRRYLTTGAEPSASWHPEAWRAPVPPQPPVRRDSLRAAPAARGDRCQASVDMLHAKGRWISDTFLCQRDWEAEVVGRRTLPPYPTKDCLNADQYYMLSSHPDRCPPEPLLREGTESDNQPYPDDSMHQVPDAMTAGDNPLLSPLKSHMSHRHSAPEQLLASQLRSIKLGTNSERASPAPSGQCWTLSPLHPEGSRGGTPGAAQDPPHCPEPCYRPPPYRCCPELQQACGQDGEGASPAVSTEGPVEEESRGGPRRAGGPPHRSAQMRRRSDRFATSLRNEIQRRKAQLQKSRGPDAPPPGEEPVEETEEPPEGSVLAERPPALPQCLSPTLSEDSRNAGRSADRGIPSPDPVPAPKGSPSPERVVPTARGHWHWSPEKKLQLQHSPSPSELKGYTQGPAACSSPPQGSDEVVLLPFADRRRFFEESSRPAPPWHSKLPAGDPGTFQPPGPEHRDVRRLSVDQPYNPPSPSRPGSAVPYAECCREQPLCYKPLGRPGELDYRRGFSYPYGVPLRPEPCRYSGGDRCALPLPREHTCRCYPVPWVRCPDCCCPAPHPGREESDAWPTRRVFIPVSNTLWDCAGGQH